jgi:ATP-binding protein involved in chromosome partitioning
VSDPTAVKSYHDVAGDGGSDVLGQVAAQRRAIEAALAGVRRVLAVGSGKGGVGKSTLTFGLARALTRRGRKVAILDADLNGPSQAQMAGVAASPWLPGADGLEPPRRRDGIAVVSTGSVLAGGRPVEFDTVSHGDGHVWRATREFALLAQLLATVRWGSLDALLVDLPPGAERTVHFAELLTGLAGDRCSFVLVTIPSEVARGVVARSVTALAATGAPLIGVIENMAGYWCRDCGAVRPLFPDSAAADAAAGPAGLGAPASAGVEPTGLGGRLLGSVPFDPALAALADRGWPEEEEAGAAVAAIDAVADRLLAALGDAGPRAVGVERTEGEPPASAPDRPAAAAPAASTREEAR